MKIAGGWWVGAQGSENGVGAGGYPNSEQPGHGPAATTVLRIHTDLWNRLRITTFTSPPYQFPHFFRAPFQFGTFAQHRHDIKTFPSPPTRDQIDDRQQPTRIHHFCNATVVGSVYYGGYRHRNRQPTKPDMKSTLLRRYHSENPTMLPGSTTFGPYAPDIAHRHITHLNFFRGAMENADSTQAGALLHRSR